MSRAIQETRVSTEFCKTLGDLNRVMELVPRPPNPWFVRGPRGGLYVATGVVWRSMGEQDFITGERVVVDRSDGLRYIRPDSKLARSVSDQGAMSEPSYGVSRGDSVRPRAASRANPGRPSWPVASRSRSADGGSRRSPREWPPLGSGSSQPQQAPRERARFGLNGDAAPLRPRIPGVVSALIAVIAPIRARRADNHLSAPAPIDEAFTLMFSAHVIRSVRSVVDVRSIYPSVEVVKPSGTREEGT